MRYLKLAILLVVASAINLSAQEVQVSRANKTITVTADASATAEPDMATVTFAFENYGATSKEAYENNIRASERVLKAMLDSGIPKEAIETENILVRRIEEDDKEKWTQEQRKTQVFEAEQSWKVKLPASEAQKLVDLVMKSGANRIKDVDWELSDHAALQAEAGAAALAKARRIADQMAKGLGTKLGELVYANNRAPDVLRYAGRNFSLNTAAVSSAVVVPMLQLFPVKIKETATVHAVFAVE
ncbi:MAG TPA: SIMPL domain-containing protein [Terriglobales bacterium]|nr:SIMPL domain-containing protein [Terriglobales bacterium]